MAGPVREQPHFVLGRKARVDVRRPAREAGRPVRGHLREGTLHEVGICSCSGSRIMTLARQAYGKSGEDLAVAELERRGYAILARRYRTRHGEIDIVARDRETVVFVEVKARATAEFGSAAEAVTRRKQRRLGSMAAEYLARERLGPVACRFDVIAIDGPSAAVTLYPGAFEVA